VECSRLAWCVGLFFLIRSLPEPFSWLVEFIRCTIVFSACPMIRDWRTFFLCGLDNGSSDHNEIECYLGNYRTETPVRNTQHTHDTRFTEAKAAMTSAKTVAIYH